MAWWLSVNSNKNQSISLLIEFGEILFGQVVFTILVMQPSKVDATKGKHTMGRNWRERREIFQKASFLWGKRAKGYIYIARKKTSAGNELMRILTMDRRLLLGILRIPFTEVSFIFSEDFSRFSKALCGPACRLCTHGEVKRPPYPNKVSRSWQRESPFISFRAGFNHWRE